MAISADSQKRAGPLGACPAALTVNKGVQVLGTKQIAAEDTLDLGDYLFQCAVSISDYCLISNCVWYQNVELG